MTNSEKETKIREALKSDLFIVKSVQDVNHRPHPYTVGPKHVTYVSDKNGGMLDESVCRKVKCAHPNCNIDFDGHTSDNICFLQLTRNGTNDEAQILFKELVETLGEKFIDGFAFVETVEKFRIS